LAQLSFAGAPDAKTRFRLLHPVLQDLLCDAFKGSTADRRPASPGQEPGESRRMDLQAFVHWDPRDLHSKTTPAGSGCLGVKPLDVVSCHNERPKHWGSISGGNYNPHLPDRFSTEGITRFPGAQCGKGRVGPGWASTNVLHDNPKVGSSGQGSVRGQERGLVQLGHGNVESVVSTDVVPVLPGFP
jgi:hypothetical protein